MMVLKSNGNLTSIIITRECIVVVMGFMWIYIWEEWVFIKLLFVTYNRE